MLDKHHQCCFTSVVMPEKCKKNAPDQKVRIRKYVYLAVMATKVLINQRLEKTSKRGTVT